MKRRIVVVLIAAAIVALGAYSFRTVFFNNNSEENYKNEDIEAIVNQPASNEKETAKVLPQNVKKILSDIKPAENFRRSVRINYQGDRQSLARTALHYKSGEKWRTQLYDSQSKLLETAVSDGKNIAIKNNNSTEVYRGSVGDSFTADAQLGVADLSFFFEMPESDISRASLERLGNESVIFIECSFPELGQTDRYWVSLNYGVVLRAETVADGKTVYRFETTSITEEKPQDSLFDLNL